MNLIYINNGASSVFDSQVLALLKYYISTNAFSEVILLFGYKNDADKKWIEAKNLDGLKVLYFKSYPNYPFFNFLNSRSIAKSLNNIKGVNEKTFFHIRGELTSYHFKSIKNNFNIKATNVLTDVRGSSWEEIKEFMNINLILKWMKLLNVRIANNELKKDVNISVVSCALKNYLIDKCKIPSSKIKINSCLVSESFKFSDKERDKIREQLNITNKDILIIFSSGGTAKWQENHIIMDIANKGFKVLNLSKVEVKHNNIINKFVPYSEVPAYLSAADVAFIWRSKSLVNNVSSPVKFSEYVACGLPVIHNGNVDLINQFSKNKDEFLQINKIADFGFLDVKTLIQSTNRDELSSKGVKEFNVKRISESYLSAYKI
jgi:hypothetical protein